MGILNIQKVPSWIILNIHEAKSWVFWIFMKWRHRHFECSKADVGVNIHEMTSWVFWIFKSWRHGHFEYLWRCHWYLNTKWRYGIIQRLTPWVFWIFIVALVFLIFIQNYVVFWIFIVMTSLQEYSKYQCHYDYSKYPWRQLWIFPWLQFVRIQNTRHELVNIQNTHDVSFLIFKNTNDASIKLPHEYSNYPWGHFMNNHDVTS